MKHRLLPIALEVPRDLQLLHEAQRIAEVRRRYPAGPWPFQKRKERR